MFDLRIQELMVRRGGKHVLGPVTISIAPGEIVALIGANGAGKSTLAESVAGLIQIGSGSVYLGSENISNLRAEKVVRQGLALVPEGRQLFLNQSVEDNLILGCYLHVRERSFVRTRLEEAYERFPVLGRKRKDIAGTLSGGEQQMLALSRGLMSQPKVLILDEPSTGLAPRIVREFVDNLTVLRDAGIAILLIEQLIQVALGVADRGYILSRGRIVAEGSSHELIHSKELVAAYLGASTVH